MIVCRCTQKLIEYFNLSLTTAPCKTEALFGEWYVNSVSTFRGDAVLFVNNPTLLSVVLPLTGISNLETDFQRRVLHLYARLTFPEEIIDHESEQFNAFLYTKTRSRSVLGCMEDIAHQLQIWSEQLVPGFGDTLESFELAMSQLPHKTLDDRHPAAVAQKIIEENHNKRK